MNVTAEELRSHYATLPDGALLEIDASELVPTARECLADEIARRGLRTTEPESAAADVLPAEPDETDELVCVAEYDHHEEAEVARELLESEQIPASIENDAGAVRLMVPVSSAERAFPLLVAPLSDEELEAQAAAAGAEEESAEEE